MDQKRKKLTPETTKKKLKLSTPDTTSHQSNLNFNCNKEVVIQIERLSESVVAEMTAGWSALPPEQSDVQKECQDAKITDLERKLDHMENKLKLVIAELEQVKEERARDKINFETEKCELESENKRLRKYLQDIESENVNIEEKSQINLYNTGLNSQITKVNGSNDDALNINSLPNEIIEKIFGYLNQNQLGQIARVCRRWNVLTKSPVLWKNVNVKFSPSHKCQTTVAESFINTVPSCVTSIRLHFTNYIWWIESLNFEQLCPRLQEKCPHLEELILIHSDLSSSLSSVISLCTQFLQDVKNLIFHYSNFRFHRGTFECFGISKIEILDLFNCYFDYSSIFESPFSKMLHLKQLHLFDTIVPNSWFEDDASFVNQLHVLNLGRTRITAESFQAIQNHGLNLKEFYVCVNWLEDHEITLNNSAFPRLKTICLADTWVTCEGVVSLIQSCPSLENVYVDEAVVESFAAHPFLAANRCKSGIVKAIGRDHIHNLDYSCI